jgi:hypothetical protein
MFGNNWIFFRFHKGPEPMAQLGPATGACGTASLSTHISHESAHSAQYGAWRPVRFRSFM